MDVEQLAIKIHQRLLGAGRPTGPEITYPVARLISKYDLRVDIKSFGDPRGIILRDKNGASVATYPTETHNSFLACKGEPFTDILVLSHKKMNLGWVKQDQIVQSDGSFTVKRQQIRTLPDEFSFILPCPHLSEFGGIYLEEDQGWQCFGCGEIVFAALEAS